MMKLTTEQIMQMQAGPAMNAAVAETIMGWTRYPKQPHPSDSRTIDGVLYCPPDAPYDMNARNVVPDYSDDVAAAWSVVEKLRECGFSFDAGSWENVGDGNDWITEFEHQSDTLVHRGLAPTMPLAICRAALLAMANLPDAARGEG